MLLMAFYAHICNSAQYLSLFFSAVHFLFDCALCDFHFGQFPRRQLGGTLARSCLSASMCHPNRDAHQSPEVGPKNSFERWIVPKVGGGGGGQTRGGLLFPSSSPFQSVTSQFYLSRFLANPITICSNSSQWWGGSLPVIPSAKPGLRVHQKIPGCFFSWSFFFMVSWVPQPFYLPALLADRPQVGQMEHFMHFFGVVGKKGAGIS